MCAYTVYYILAHITVAPTGDGQASGCPPQPTMHGKVAADRLSGNFVFYIFVCLFIYLFYILLGEGDVQMPCALVEAKTTCRLMFSPPTPWDLGVELKLSDLIVSTLSH